MVILAALAVAGYLLAAHRTYRIGFPLDDAWIHQTYARNLARHGEWAFVPGHPSAGSTAPLWSFLLAAGYLTGLAPYGWTFTLGVLTLAGLACAGVWGLGVLQPALPARWRWLGGALLALEWHLVWAAASGMETLLVALLTTLAVLWMVRGVRHWAVLGGLIGLGMWVRPDVVTLLGPAGLTLGLQFLRARRWQSGAVLRLLAGFAAGFLPYLLFNRWLAGAWWPNTFYAKQAEYAVLRQASLLARLGREMFVPLVGAGALLLPGVAVTLRQAAGQRRWMIFGGALWSLGYMGLYALRLPVTYQHGRYLIPAMPIFFLWGFSGVLETLQRARGSLWGRVLSRSWGVTLGLVLVSFYALGGRAYGQDVAVIESEMVAASHWVNAHTPRGSLIAAHDIGALGYFGERDLLDLAGLVSPEVIPFIRDERQLAAYLNARGAQYLVSFPGWYPGLTRCGDVVYTSGGIFAPAQGGENVLVYRWHENCVPDE
ncbi:MAG: hypothetical protein Fur0018_12910 [Anaerolineales bacterium]